VTSRRAPLLLALLLAVASTTIAAKPRAVVRATPAEQRTDVPTPHRTLAATATEVSAPSPEPPREDANTGDVARKNAPPAPVIINKIVCGEKCRSEAGQQPAKGDWPWSHLTPIDWFTFMLVIVGAF
jgi:hypothetical protein